MTPAHVNNARGLPLVNMNARITKNIAFTEARKLAAFLELYNITNRANFGNQYFANACSPATYGKPNGYLGGIGVTSTLTNTFQAQIGARFSF